jgi:peptide/nickel transport system permease protein
MARLSWKNLPGPGILLTFVILAIVGPLMVDFDPVLVNTRQRFLPPFTQLQDGTYAIFGTDQLGRDILAQILVGARVSLGIALSAAFIAALIGALVGIAAGWAGGSTSEAIMRVIDVQLSFPSILIAVFLAAFVPPSILTVIVVLAVTRWAAIARLARAITLKACSQSYVESALVSGLPTWRIITTCVLPNLAAPLLILLTADLSLIILAEASLSYVGLGTPPSIPSWGRIIANGRNFLDNAWWISTIPGVAISLIVIAIGLTGELLRRHFARDGWTML